MMVLTIAVGDLKRLCSIPTADTSQDAALTALLSAEQPVHEYALDPGILARGVVSTVAPPALDDPGLNATLTLGVCEVLAGSFLTDLGRFPHFAEPLPLSVLNAVAATVLTVATSDIKRLLSITDISQDTAVAACITAEQLALEYALDPDVLAAAVSVGTPNAGLKAWLTLGVSEQIAGTYLEQSGRVPGLGVDVQISSLHFVTSHAPKPDALGASLAAQGTARLLPFSRHIRAEHRLKPTLNQPDLLKIGVTLTAQGLARLAPFTRAKRAANVAAAGTTPDDFAPIPQLISGGILPGALIGTPPSVFNASTFGDAFSDLGPNGSLIECAENEGWNG